MVLPLLTALAHPTGSDAQEVRSEVYIAQVAASPVVRADRTSADDERSTTMHWDALLSWINEWGVAPSSMVAGPSPAGALEIPGAGNVAVIEQEGGGNTARLEQAGHRNVVVIRQIGMDNGLEALQQGDDNTLDVVLTGSNNRLDLAQLGDANRYDLDFTGNHMDHSVVQIGSGLSATQIGTGSLPFGIQQRGTGMSIRIEHNPGR